ncbi:hypothetical protein A9G11_03655 [Gilliamella sp. wkB108]|uniref:hypothetical protein n=1 Tax=Gilliamella sp. wkB108 TaxID=3120256 RepID=UPI00080DA110|nr:hypothetical protein [Gilliamella apicola]OCG24760.1 hypothetical protein A9G11_03655 [Gilliamella apicola]
MTNKKIIKRLIKGNWYLKAEDDHDLALILNACHDAKLTWISGNTKVSEVIIEDGGYILHPIYFIGIDCDDTELSYSHTPSAFEFTYDITDWFYREVIND